MNSWLKTAAVLFYHSSEGQRSEITVSARLCFLKALGEDASLPLPAAVAAAFFGVALFAAAQLPDSITVWFSLSIHLLCCFPSSYRDTGLIGLSIHSTCVWLILTTYNCNGPISK